MPRDGSIGVPSGHGLGVSLDRDKLARAHEVYKKYGMCGTRRRDPDEADRAGVDRGTALGP
jgi:hypothetical protein